MTVERYLNTYVYGAKAPKVQLGSSSGANYSSTTTEHFNLLHLFGTSPLAIFINALLLLFIIFAVFYTTLEVLEYKRLFKQKAVYLELTPPAFNTGGLAANAQLFSILHGLRLTQSPKDRLLRRKVKFSLEIVSTKAKGIRFIARVPEDYAVTFKREVRAFSPDVKISKAKDYLLELDDSIDATFLDFKPIGRPNYGDELSKDVEQDSLAYLLGAMTQLDDHELMGFQLVLSPVSLNAAIKRRDRLDQVGRSHEKGRGWLINLIWFCLRSAQGLIKQTLDYIKELQFGESSIMSRPLFEVNMRALIVADSPGPRVLGLKSALSSLGDTNLIARDRSSEYSLWQYKNRLLGVLPSSFFVLSSYDLAAIYNLSSESLPKTENLIRSLKHDLPAPVSLKGSEQPDVIIGNNIYHDTVTPIGLSQEERRKHLYIVGGTGNGKTTMLEYMIMQDIKNNKGVCVVDPHGDLAKTVLTHIPRKRMKDVIYLNPRDLDYPVGINLLELPEGLSGSALEHEKDMVTEAVVSVLRKTFSDDDSGGHKIEYILRNAIHTAMSVEGATIFTILKLLTDFKYRRTVVNKLEDEDLKNFWLEEFGKAGSMQRVKMSSGVTAKIGRFRRSVAVQRILGQTKSTISFEDIMSSSKILICNFSKGRIGEDTSSLLGTIILAKLQLAALRREEVDTEARAPFYLYVDEFQDFATMPFLQMLSEARKYKLYLTMAEQSLSQQENQRFSNIILANVGTLVCFRSGSPSDERLLLPLFKPYLQEGDINNLASYNFYLRLSGVNPKEPTSGVTLLLDESGSVKTAKTVVLSSRQAYSGSIP